MKIRAAVAEAAGLPLDVTTVDLAAPGPGEVLVEMKATGLCHSDLSAIDGLIPAFPFPLVPGHEGAGIVAEVGPGVVGLEPGDLVIPSGLAECGQCRPCLSGKGNICVRRAKPTRSPLSLRGQELTVFAGTATFAEYAVITRDRLVGVRGDAPADVVCYVGCGVMTGIDAVLNTGAVTPGSSVAVFGLGGIGLNCIQAARIAGAAKIIGIDINPAREAIARQFGATHFVNPRGDGDVVARLRGLTHGIGVDFSFECIGNTDIANQALEATDCATGVAVGVGVMAPGQRLSFDPNAFLTGRTWKGSMLGGGRASRAVPRLIDWYMDGFIKIDELITHRITLDEINHGFDLMRRGEAIRTVVVF